MYCLFTANPDVINLFYVSKMRSEGQEFVDLRASMLPAGIPTRITYAPFKRSGSYLKIEVLTEKIDNSYWPGYVNGGVEFPSVNPDYVGRTYDHFWAVGQAQLLGDRLYHTQISTMERRVYLVPGYAP